MARTKRLNRTTDMDAALYEALQTRVPDKDTGPDPDDVLRDLFDDIAGAGEEGKAVGAAGDVLREDDQATELTMRLDEVDREIVADIVQSVVERTGEQPDTAQAIRIALRLWSSGDTRMTRVCETICGNADQKNRI